ncbi:VOC family protein [Pelovirga terrestris]|uniref:VOC family protein n=1 Tax=Pelovirga terrestris TaxID=2771352 RepID=A0A8J6QZH3_9BACT|nr:VOC family protein [Pelovirga terrestris]MBD1401337.1 VOC family protein [Pelovirga terrestris]
MPDDTYLRPHLVGINHVALEVGDIEQALEFYGQIFQFKLRGRSDNMAFMDMGDQFLALSQNSDRHPDQHRHFGLVVDDRSNLRARLEALAVEMIPGVGLNFRDPWGNYIQVVVYADIQFSKTPAVLKGMGLELTKTPDALQQLREKGLG